MELFLLYVWMKLDTLIGVLIMVTSVLGIWGLIGYLWAHESIYEDVTKKRAAWFHPILFRRIIPSFLSLGFLLVTLPTQTQTAVLVAGHYALKMAHTPEASKVMSVLRKKANEYLDEQLTDEVKK